MSSRKEYSITCLVGETGCGKTSIAQKIVLDSKTKGKKVWANVPLFGAMELDFNDLLKYEFTKDNEEGVLIIDEAGIYINNRDWEKLSKDVITFFKLHRHFRIDVFIFSQGEDIDITFRRLAHSWFKIIKPWYGFGKYSVLIPVITALVLENGKWCLRYEANDSIFSRQHINISKMWKYFNSFSKPNLPVKEFTYWNTDVILPVPFKTKLFIKLKNIITSIKKLFIYPILRKRNRNKAIENLEYVQEFKDITLEDIENV